MDQLKNTSKKTLVAAAVILVLFCLAFIRIFSLSGSLNRQVEKTAALEQKLAALKAGTLAQSELKKVNAELAKIASQQTADRSIVERHDVFLKGQLSQRMGALAQAAGHLKAQEDALTGQSGISVATPVTTLASRKDSGLRSTLEITQGSLKATRDALQITQESMKRLLTELAEKNTANKELNELLRKSAESTQDLSASLSEAARGLSNKEGELTRLKTLIAESQQNSANLTKLLNEMKSNIAAKVTALVTAEKQLKERDTSLAAANGKADTLAKELADREAKLADGTKALAQSQARVLDLEAKAQKPDVEQALRSSLEAEKLKLHSMEDSLRKAQSELVKREKALEDLRETARTDSKKLSESLRIQQNLRVEVAGMLLKSAVLEKAVESQAAREKSEQTTSIQTQHSVPTEVPAKVLSDDIKPAVQPVEKSRTSTSATTPEPAKIISADVKPDEKQNIGKKVSADIKAVTLKATEKPQTPLSKDKNIKNLEKADPLHSTAEKAEKAVQNMEKHVKEKTAPTKSTDVKK